jgi:hypothetical protein
MNGVCSDFISDMVFYGGGGSGGSAMNADGDGLPDPGVNACDPTHLLFTSGDGTLTCFDMAASAVIGHTNYIDDELMSVAVMKVHKVLTLYRGYTIHYTLYTIHYT